MTKYLLLKLAEEAGELVVAAIKHRIHNTAATRRELEGEIADVLAIVQLMIAGGNLDNKRIHMCQLARHKRELKRISNR